MMLEAKLADPPKILATVAVAAFAALALVLLGFAPQVEAGEPGALARGDKLTVASADCAQQDWPNISAACLHQGDANPVLTHVRMVDTR